MICYGVNNFVEDKKSMFEVVIKGHARYAAKGYDIVCASASAYSHFFIEEVLALKLSEDIKVNDGYIRVVIPSSKNTRRLIRSFMSCMDNLKIQFPKHVMEIDTFD